MTAEDDIEPSREEIIQGYILDLLGKDPNGFDIDTIDSDVTSNLNIRPPVREEEIGPNLYKLCVDRLVSQFQIVTSDGKKLAFRVANFTSSVSAKTECYVKGHDVPDDLAVEVQSAIYKGGFCRRCGRLANREFLANSWIEAISHDEKIGELRSYGVSAATSRRLRVMTGL